MHPITILSEGKESKIYIENSFIGLSELIDDFHTIVLIDENINRLYPSLFEDLPKIIIHASETSKTLETATLVYEQLIELEADRHSFILGIGGGIVCDITGFVASTFMRGIQFGFVATTLMAQVDAAIGGKNGVNFNRYKNMIGTFNQPEFVWCNTSILSSLPIRERNAGFAEIIKYGLIQNPEILDFIETFNINISNFNSDNYTYLIKETVSIKAAIINIDPHEKGLRKILNFGHTLGHAIEKNSSKYNHGEAISIGMIAALSISKNSGGFSEEEIIRIEKLLEKFALPITTEPSLISNAIDSIAADKKRNQDSIDFIIISEIGNATIQSIELSELKSLLLKLI